jgi:hypothetical protein
MHSITPLHGFTEFHIDELALNLPGLPFTDCKKPIKEVNVESVLPSSKHGTESKFGFILTGMPQINSITHY